MSAPPKCEHAETTTLLWLYGEGPEDHVHHVVSCPECQEVVRLHSDVAAVVLPVADQLAVHPPTVEVEPEPLPEPANRGWWVGVVIGLAAAAAVLLALFGALGLPGASDETPIAERDAPVEAPVEDPIVVPDEVTPEPDLPRELAVDDAPAPAPGLDAVVPELLVETPIDIDPEAELLAEALLDEAFGGDFDADIQALYDEFDALEADLTTL